jgi:hypothetical protein
MVIWRQGQRVKVECVGMVDSEKNVIKKSEGGGCGKRLLEIESWGRLVSLVSQVPSDYSNLHGQLDTTSSNF